MGSASRTAIAKGIAALDAAKSVTLTDGEQILAAARALDASAQLRALLADPTLDAKERESLVAKVFGSFGASAIALLGSLAAERWSNASQLVDGIEEIGIRAIARAETKADIVAELFAVERAVRSDAELELALGSKLASAESKAEVVTRLLAKQGSAATNAIVRHLVQSPRGRRIGALLRRTAEVVADVTGRVVATVTVAAPLSDGQQAALAADITARFGREPRIQYLIDPAVIGGVRVRVGQTVIDGTIASRIADLRLQLAG